MPAITGSFLNTIDFDGGPFSLPVGPFAFGGNLYVFAFSSYPNDPITSLCVSTTPAVISCFRSTDGGTTWAIVDALGSKSATYWDQQLTFAGPRGDPRSVTCQRLGNSVFVMYVSPDFFHDPLQLNTQIKLRIAEFHLATELWNPATTDSPVYGPAQAGTVTGADPTLERRLMTVAASGTIYVAVSNMTALWNPFPSGGVFGVCGWNKLVGGIGGVWGAWTLLPALPPLAPNPILTDYRGGGFITGLLSSATDGTVHIWYEHGSDSPAFPNQLLYFVHYLLDDGTGVPGVAPPVQMLPPYGQATNFEIGNPWASRAWTANLSGVEYIGYFFVPLDELIFPPPAWNPHIYYSSDKGATWASDILTLDYFSNTLFVEHDGSVQVDIPNNRVYFYLSWGPADETTVADMKYITWDGPGLLGAPTTLIPQPMSEDGSTWTTVMAPPYGEPFSLLGVLYGKPAVGPGEIALTYLIGVPSEVRTTEAFSEVFSSPTGEERATEAFLEVFSSPPGEERVTEAFLEAFSSPPPDGRVTEAFLETFSSPPSSLRVTEAFLEVFYSPAPPTLVTLRPSGSSGYKLHVAIPNVYDCCLYQEGEQLRRLDLKRQTCPMIEDWDGRTIPGLGREFLASKSILTPPVVAGNVQVLTWTPGPGENGMLYGIVFWYTGTGFVPGSGDIFWRLKVGRAWAPDLGNVGIPLGAPGSPWGIQDYIPVGQGQVVQVLVEIQNLSGFIQIGTSRIVAQLQGWTWPQY